MREIPILFSPPMVRALLAGRKTVTRRLSKRWLKVKAGDVLWVREAFQPIFAEGFEHGGEKYPDWKTGEGYAIRYVATEGRTDWIDGEDNITDRCKPGIHMPRWASRITLEITGVRVERVRSISEEDAIAEGVEPELDWTATMKYAVLWDKINGKKYPWASNPFVWVIEFKRLETR